MLKMAIEAMSSDCYVQAKCGSRCWDQIGDCCVADSVAVWTDMQSMVCIGVHWNGQIVLVAVAMLCRWNSI